MSNYGLCTDPNCEYEDEKALLFNGVCEACYEDQAETDAFNRANSFDMYDEDYGQVPYGSMYNYRASW